MSPDDWMRKAIELAHQAREIHEVPVGAILVANGEVIGRGSNTRETSQRTLGHAELGALEDYNHSFGSWRLPPHTTLYVTVEPCLMCTGAFLTARVAEIAFGCRDPKQAGLSALLPLIEEGRFDHRFSSVSPGILEAECRQLLTQFFQKKRRGEF